MWGLTGIYRWAMRYRFTNTLNVARSFFLLVLFRMPAFSIVLSLYDMINADLELFHVAKKLDIPHQSLFLVIRVILGNVK